jgi:hypothetical protein
MDKSCVYVGRCGVSVCFARGDDRESVQSDQCVYTKAHQCVVNEKPGDQNKNCTSVAWLRYLQAEES